jgi:quercetin dioxygenase-like cupin family protein
MSDDPSFSTPTIDDVRLLQRNVTWPTKSNGELSVLFGINFTDLDEKYLHYEKTELARVPRDIRGLRSYTVTGLKKQSIGANEWHRIRNELVFVTRGRVKWSCEDVFGNKLEYELDEKSGVWTPPFILHAYKALEDDSELLVIANTLFFPEDPLTHDTYDLKSFGLLKDHYSNL